MKSCNRFFYYDLRKWLQPRVCLICFSVTSNGDHRVKYFSNNKIPRCTRIIRVTSLIKTTGISKDLFYSISVRQFNCLARVSFSLQSEI